MEGWVWRCILGKETETHGVGSTTGPLGKLGSKVKKNSISRTRAMLDAFVLDVVFILNLNLR